MACKLIEPDSSSLKFILTNKEYKPYQVKLDKIFQIWKVKGKFTPDISFLY